MAGTTHLACRPRLLHTMSRVHRKLPQLHQTRLDPSSLIGCSDISHEYEIDHASLRSWATWRRTSKKYGFMPLPVCLVSNRPLWKRTDINSWVGHGPVNPPRIFGR